ncbi:bifunctional adenosylcobinamide kinase/adenosylcobinamide-phosphate guanylyltransferase [Pseudoalteromonas maricaloris]|uniref:bifunctional adenosylcobinamide kinase/adenosylcobinamide-phosphate guanylyltransferase n=1 Tax=Pseudoalteromonas maricaloris TaxID=184924 RepID=UPI00057C5719|nr:bifunctional adenosylcobinamide kinase/adenosylcobinamide-phosphate guanylyltransferase [Pseudoalteromonas flavipulchra]KID36663.1 adenosylcobinamide kinase [Pseudoalteromonas flavipulchra NCIMB 2033 = ATCC BAA-314]MBD0782459.1 bifunctional adenosylcobinamide kinase/adenosylcobinamide-phosphate guanylyltransferase [Pseudoalteromonas flavipulchra]MBE0373927.1 adenosylcobinamide kinase / adenosylcobinamide-phosphate guanylyltransferase [Pseudoalteromonas flavipulchra NCIMB 2033 = ATCC BAA-314]
MAQIQLILGGARSGKSRLAEQRAILLLEQGAVNELYYVATAKAQDEEMKSRVFAHQMQRDSRWQLVEESWHIDKLIATAREDALLLIDCLTLWLSFGLCEMGKAATIDKKEHVLAALESCAATVILVSNEVGHGIIPLGELSREFVDESGWLHQDIAKVADRVDFVIAGLPQCLKGQDV